LQCSGKAGKRLPRRAFWDRCTGQESISTKDASHGAVIISISVLVNHTESSCIYRLAALGAETLNSSTEMTLIYSATYRCCHQTKIIAYILWEITSQYINSITHQSHRHKNGSLLKERFRKKYSKQTIKMFELGVR